MRFSVIFLVCLLLVSGVSASTGENVFDAWSNAGSLQDFCSVNGGSWFDCWVRGVGVESGVIDESIINNMKSASERTEPLTDVILLNKRLDNSRDRFISLLELFGHFFFLTFIMIGSFVIFLELYIILWLFFVGVPKVLNIIVLSFVKTDFFKNNFRGKK